MTDDRGGIARVPHRSSVVYERGLPPGLSSTAHSRTRGIESTLPPPTPAPPPQRVRGPVASVLKPSGPANLKSLQMGGRSVRCLMSRPIRDRAQDSHLFQLAARCSARQPVWRERSDPIVALADRKLAWKMACPAWRNTRTWPPLARFRTLQEGYTERRKRD